MLTFTAAYSALTNKGYGKVFTVASLYYNDEASYLRLAPKDFYTIEDTYYAGIIQSVSPVTSTINPKDSSYSVSNCEVRIAEGMYSSTQTVAAYLAFSTNNYRNRKILLSYAADGCGDADIVLYFSGVVTDVSFDEQNKQWVLQCVSSGELKHKELPTTIVTREAYPNAADSSIGARLPIVYGEFLMQAATAGRPQDEWCGLFHLAPSICTDYRTGIYTVAGHACDSLSRACVYLDDIGTYGISLQTNAGTAPATSVTGPSTITLPMPSGTQYYKVMDIYLIPKLQGTQHTAGDNQNIVDRDATTTTALAGLNPYKYYYAKFTGLEGNGDGFLITLANPSTDIQLYTFATAISGGGTCRFMLYNGQHSGGTTEYVADAFTTTGGKVGGIANADVRTENDGTNLTVIDQWSWEEIGRYEYGLRIPNGTTVTLAVFGLNVNDYHISGNAIVSYRQRAGNPNQRDWGRDRVGGRAIPDVKYDSMGIRSQVVESISGLFTEVRGREYGSWINTGGRSQTPIDFTTGDMIWLPQGIVESILRDELGLVDANIDEASFDAATQTYEMAFSLTQPTVSKQLISEISRSSSAVAYCGSDGIWKYYAFPTTPSSSTLDLKYDEIKLNNPRTANDWLANKVIVNYNYDYAKGEFTHDISSTSTASQGTTVAGENRTVTEYIDCPYFRFETGSTQMASVFASRQLAQWKDPHLLIDFDVLDPSLWKLQEGDVVTFANVPSTFTGGMYATGSATDHWASWGSPRTKYFLIISCARQNDKVSYTGFQLHNL